MIITTTKNVEKHDLIRKLYFKYLKKKLYILDNVKQWP